ncbi:AAA family ATPase [Hyphomicrobium sulfonivorans]|uniref:AAA family ATPase n=1 Tax=Hyphomicrobium sulfonivorans TaxID=121290 RepID=UPI0015709AEA|nr:ATP-binding protein [Hyphomicrobium sulfonivorans]MBI1648297.1 AAA family ATPase [Hyphomicrobium sulfonivorans]
MFFKRFMPGKGKAVAQATETDADAQSGDASASAMTAAVASATATDAASATEAAATKTGTKLWARKTTKVSSMPMPAIDAAELGFKTTAELTPSPAPVGQEKALEALTFAASMKGSGYHILVTGEEGSGRRTATRTILRSVAADLERPDDWIYVNAFDAENGFRALKLPAGTAKVFAQKMALAVDELAEALPAAFAADDFDLKRRMIEEEHRFRREDALQALQQEAEAQNIALLRTPAGIAVAPILEGKVVKTDVFNAIPEAMQREVETKIAAVEAELAKIVSDNTETEEHRCARLDALTAEIAGRHVQAALEKVHADFAEIDGVTDYLEAAGSDMISNAGLFVAHAETNDAGSAAGRTTQREGGSVRLVQSAAAHPRFARYGVHVMAASPGNGNGGAPIAEETNPSYSNLFGRVELAHDSDGQPRIVRIRPGALHRANGGFLLLEADALLSAGAAVSSLLRALETSEIRFDPPTDPVGVIGDEIPTLEPLPFNVKLVLIASDAALKLLKASHPALVRAFKSRAPFEEAVSKSTTNIAKFAGLVAYIVEKHDLRPFNAEAVAMLINEATQRAGDPGLLALPVSELVDLCRAADHWADNEDRKTVSADDVAHALQHFYGDDATEHETRRAMP